MLKKSLDVGYLFRQRFLQLSRLTMVFAGSTFHKGLVFLFGLAWDCRFRLPLLITIGFMALDVRMQLEINVDADQRHVQGGEEDGESEYSSNDVSVTEDEDYLSSYEESEPVG